MHIILHALSLFVVAQCVTVMNINYQRSKLGDWSKVQHSTVNAKTEVHNCKIIRQRVEPRP